MPRSNPLHLTIHGKTCEAKLLEIHPAGTVDVEVTACAAMPGLIGKAFRVTGLAFDAPCFIGNEQVTREEFARRVGQRVYLKNIPTPFEVRS